MGIQVTLFLVQLYSNNVHISNYCNYYNALQQYQPIYILIIMFCLPLYFLLRTIRSLICDNCMCMYDCYS